MSMQQDDDHEQPFTSFMGRNKSDRGDPFMRGLKSSFRQADDPNDFHSPHKRRERVYMWHRRWAMPTYDRMKKQVEKTSGLDITVADLDLLPWSKSGKSLDNAAYHKMQRQAFLESAKVKRQQSLRADDLLALQADQAQLRAKHAQEQEAKAKAEEEARQKARQDMERQREERKRAQELARQKAKQEALKAEQERQRLEELAKQEKEQERKRQAEEAARRAAQERLNLRRQQAPAVTNGNSPMERAYDWYDKLHEPTLEQMIKASKMTQGMDLTANQINALPWNNDGTALNYPNLHTLLEQATGTAELVLKDEKEHSSSDPLSTMVDHGLLGKEKVGRVGVPSLRGGRDGFPFTPRSSKGIFHLTADEQKSLVASFTGDNDKNKRKAFGWYLTLGRPNLRVMTQILTHAQGMSVSVEDLDLLPWEQENGNSFVLEQHMVLPNNDQEKYKRRLERRQREDEARDEEAAEFEEWKKKEQTPAPPVQPEHVHSGDVATAYRWYKRLGEPTKYNFLAVAKECKGIPVTTEQVEHLPWIKEDRALDHEHLTEMLEQEEKDAATNATDNVEPLIDPAILASILKAYREYKALNMPKYITFTTLIEETTGLNSSQDEVDGLPWDEDRILVDEDRIAELRRLLDEYLVQQNKQDAAKRKRAEERRKRREDLARKVQEEKDAKLRQQQQKAAHEEEEARKKEEKVRLVLMERMSLRELDFKRHKGDKKSWEESRALKAYAWYTRMSGPNKKQLKAIVSSMKECDVVPDDIDLLPWSASGGWVDHVKIDELSARRKDVVY